MAKNDNTMMYLGVATVIGVVAVAYASQARASEQATQATQPTQPTGGYFSSQAGSGNDSNTSRAAADAGAVMGGLGAMLGPLFAALPDMISAGKK